MVSYIQSYCSQTRVRLGPTKIFQFFFSIGKALRAILFDTHILIATYLQRANIEGVQHSVP